MINYKPVEKKLRYASAFGLFGIALLVCFSYGKIINSYFTSDDFALLADASRNGFSIKGLFIPSGGHWRPVTKFITAVEYHYLGANPKPYLLLNIFFHIANVFAVYNLFNKLAPKNKYFGLLGALLFAVSTSHWRITMWIATQVTQIATFFFLIGTSFFVSFVKDEKRHVLLAAVICHILMLLSYTTGLTVPLLFFFYYLFFSKRQNNSGTRFGKLLSSFFVALPFILNSVVFLCVRFLLLDNVNFPDSNTSDVIKTVVTFMLGGINYGFVETFTGATYFEWSSLTGLRFYVATILILFLCFFDYSKLQQHSKLLVWFLLGVILLYFLPIIPRAQQGYDWFISRSRYRYLPCIPFSGLLALLFLHIKLLRNKYTAIFPLAFLIFVIVANVTYLREQSALTSRLTKKFELIANNYIDDIGKLLKQQDGYFRIADFPFSDAKSNYAGFNVTPSLINAVYFPENLNSGVKFVTTLETGDVFRVGYASGFLRYFRKSSGKLTPDEWFNKGFLLWDGGNCNYPRQVIAYYEQAINLSPTNSFYYKNLGLVHYAMQSIEVACENFNKACESGDCAILRQSKASGTCN